MAEQVSRPATREPECTYCHVEIPSQDLDKAKQFYDDFGDCLTPHDIARTVVFALQQPPNMVISQLVVLPNAQT